MMYYIRINGDRAKRRWKVREAVSLRAAYTEVVMAMATGSIGGTTITKSESGQRVVSSVIRVNSDLTEAQPYQAAY